MIRHTVNVVTILIAVYTLWPVVSLEAQVCTLLLWHWCVGTCYLCSFWKSPDVNCVCVLSLLAPQSTVYRLRTSLCLCVTGASILSSELLISQVGGLTTFTHISALVLLEMMHNGCICDHFIPFLWEESVTKVTFITSRCQFMFSADIRRYFSFLTHISVSCLNRVNGFTMKLNT